MNPRREGTKAWAEALFLAVCCWVPVTAILAGFGFGLAGRPGARCYSVVGFWPSVPWEGWERVCRMGDGEEGFPRWVM